MCFFGKDRKAGKATVYSLSPKSDLDMESKTLTDIYCQHLSVAFKNESIHNIAVTGEFGIGKSSIIRTFDKVHTGKKPHFLYISLGEFQESSNHREHSDAEHFQKAVQNENAQNGCEEGTGAKQGTDGEPEIERESSEIERRLLLQIYAQFLKKEYPGRAFATVREKSSFQRSRWIRAFFCSLFLICAAGIFLHKEAGEFLLFLHEQKNSWTVWSFLWEQKTTIHIFMYVYIVVMLAIVAWKIAFHIAPGLTIANLSLKAGYIEAEIQKTEENMNLDRQSLELVYLLEQIKDEIGGTVVFEDMDRLSAEICIKIFTRLREINHMANSRIMRSRQGMTSPIRFVYVINDTIANQLLRTKFFDYILPIIPTLIPSNSFSQFWKRWKEVNGNMKVLTGNESEKEQKKLENEFRPIFEYVDLTHYRTQFTILNDYSILCCLWKSTHTVLCQDVRILLALAIYKNVFPEDYGRIWEGKSYIIPQYDPPKAKAEIQESEKESLLLSLHGLIGEADTLLYLGYSGEAIQEIRRRQKNTSHI